MIETHMAFIYLLPASFYFLKLKSLSSTMEEIQVSPPCIGIQGQDLMDGHFSFKMLIELLIPHRWGGRRVNVFKIWETGSILPENINFIWKYNFPCYLPSPEDWSELNCLRPFVEAHQAFEKCVTTRKKTCMSRNLSMLWDIFVVTFACLCKRMFCHSELCWAEWKCKSVGESK